ncbi:hypothetical protein [Sphingomonas sp.]|uniref:hypothetical protein n=1 Tax=Sphingomonas sp. TaxID=28214 RepID=UPI001EBAAD74|nr:hypothetical protein [Sphingomonas sp.]MBX3594285.1 hypothetical protein [Sphingomonas sp.]
MVKALSGFGWFLTGVVVAPGCYMVSSQVASERTRVEGVERAIAKAHKDIRDLETEFDTRANLAQLERWNGEVMRFAAPTPQQFLASDTQLASLRPLEGDGLAQRYAAMVVPQGVAGVAGSAAKAVDAAAGSAAEAVAKAAPAPKPDPAAATRSAATAVAQAKPVAEAAKSERVAMLDRKLLDDSSFGDLMKGVKAEASRLR